MKNTLNKNKWLWRRQSFQKLRDRLWENIIPFLYYEVEDWEVYKLMKTKWLFPKPLWEDIDKNLKTTNYSRYEPKDYNWKLTYGDDNWNEVEYDWEWFYVFWMTTINEVFEWLSVDIKDWTYKWDFIISKINKEPFQIRKQSYRDYGMWDKEYKEFVDNKKKGRRKKVKTLATWLDINNIDWLNEIDIKIKNQERIPGITYYH